MGSTAERIEKRFTYAEYASWKDDQRWELIDGVPYNMTPAPRTQHQNLLGNLFREVSSYLKGKQCRSFIAPTDVVFDDFNVVQPDLLVVCDRSKITEANIQGAPDLIVEILSPATSRKDRREKKALYERSGVQEYILVDPANEVVERYALADGKYGAEEVFGWDESMALLLFPDLLLNWWEIFEKERVDTVNEPGPGYSAENR
ncbi:MAG TPA: Uma2 family endonuclease [Desulfurivibrionaceae bacterium]|nr:Uma2 family endonuclease [Desulfurivibrionaceae bacterium]